MYSAKDAAVPAQALAKQKPGRMITADEVKMNNGGNGVYWTVMKNRVYDITNFLGKHPGGDIVRLCAGRDGTDLMESYHPISAQGKAQYLLNEFYIGDLVVPADKAAKVAAPDDTFFVTVRDRVEKKLKSIGYGRHFYEWLALAEVLLTTLLYMYGTYYIAVHRSYLAAVGVGLATGRMGFFMHMGNHRAISSSATVNRIVEGLMDFIGGSSRIWSYEHAVAHHLTPNTLWTDNDCSIGEPLLRFHPGIPWIPLHRIQAPGTIIAMTFGVAKWYFSDVVHFFKGAVGSQKFALTSADWVQLGFFKTLWFCLHILLPYYYHGSLGFATASAFIIMAVSAHYLENIFIVNHIQPELIPDPTLHWAQQQTIGSADWASGSYFWNFFSGGLNHQIEHHLFPSISHHCYPAIAPIVEQTCKEFGLPYNNFPSFPAAWYSMYSYLHRLGQPPSSPLHLSSTAVKLGHPSAPGTNGNGKSAEPQARQASPSRRQRKID